MEGDFKVAERGEGPGRPGKEQVLVCAPITFLDITCVSFPSREAIFVDWP